MTFYVHKTRHGYSKPEEVRSFGTWKEAHDYCERMHGFYQGFNFTFHISDKPC